MLFAEKCVEGIEANLEGCERSAEGTLAVATALNPFIGYDKAAEIVKDASKSGRTLREVAREHGVDEETLDKALDLRKIAAGSKATELSSAARAHRRVLRRRPRAASRVEDHGALRLFVKEGPGWPYYARPIPGAGPADRGRDRRGARAPARPRRARGARVDPRRRARPARRGARGADAGQGRAADGARRGALAHARSARRRHRPPARRPATPRSPPAARCSTSASGNPGTAVGEAGPAERDASAVGQSAVELDFLSERIRNGLTQPAVAEDEGGVLAGGSHQPVGEVTAIVGVATLPSARRRGLAALVTARLVQDARERGAELVFIEAEDADVARIYGRLGFERVGTACIAEPL